MSRNQTFNSYYLEMGATYKEALKISMERYKELEEENRKLKERIEELEKEIEELNKMMLFETKI